MHLCPTRDAVNRMRYCVPCGMRASSAVTATQGTHGPRRAPGPVRSETERMPSCIIECARKRAHLTPYHTKHALEVLNLQRRVATAEEAAAGNRMRLAAAKATDPKAHSSCMQALEVLELRDRVACLEEAAVGARSRLAAASDDVHRLERATLALEERLAAAQRCGPVPCWAVLEKSIHMLSLLGLHVNWFGPAGFLHPPNSYQLSMHGNKLRHSAAMPMARLLLLVTAHAPHHLQLSCPLATGRGCQWLGLTCVQDGARRAGGGGSPVRARGGRGRPGNRRRARRGPRAGGARPGAGAGAGAGRAGGECVCRGGAAQQRAPCAGLCLRTGMHRVCWSCRRVAGTIGVPTDPFLPIVWRYMCGCTD